MGDRKITAKSNPKNNYLTKTYMNECVRQILS